MELIYPAPQRYFRYCVGSAVKIFKIITRSQKINPWCWVYSKLNLVTEKQQRIFDFVLAIVVLGLLVWAFLSFFNEQIIFNLIVNDAAGFKIYLLGLGEWQEVAYFLAVMMEVIVAFIPGWFVYPVGAALFGFSKAVLLVLLGNFVGASLCFWIGHKFGSKLLKKFVSAENLERYEKFMEQKGFWSIFLLKLNPVTSLDVISYVAGASPLKYWKFSLANTLGLIPLVVFSTYLGEESLKIAPQILGILFLITILYILWSLVSLPKSLRNKNK